jgi:hypothetical protein
MHSPASAGFAQWTRQVLADAPMADPPAPTERTLSDSRLTPYKHAVDKSMRQLLTKHVPGSAGPSKCKHNLLHGTSLGASW